MEARIHLYSNCHSRVGEQGREGEIKSTLPTHPGLFHSALILSHYNMLCFTELICFLSGELTELGSSREAKHSHYSTIRFLLFGTRKEKYDENTRKKDCILREEGTCDLK